MPHKLHNHNSLVKRLKIVGPRHERKFKFIAVGKRHLNRNKSRSNLMRKRKNRYIHKAD
jgi:ribosomal protein L35